MPGQGHKSFMQFTPEVTFGTAPTLFRWRSEVISANITPANSLIPDPSLYSGVSRRGLFEGGKLYRGTVVLRCNYEGLLEFLRAVSGTYTGPAFEAGFDHTFKEGSTLKSYSVELSVGDVPAGKAFRLTGCKFTGVTIRGTAGTGAEAMVQCELTLLAKDMVANITPSSEIANPAPGALTIPASPNNNTITRGAGSFVTDGVKVGQVVSHANFPAGTTVTAVVALTVTVNQFGTAAGSLTIAFQPGYPVVYPVLFHQMQIADDGVCNAPADVPGTVSAGTTFTRSAGSNTTDGIVAGYAVAGVGLPADTVVASVTSPTVLVLSRSMANVAVTLTFTAPIRLRSFEWALDNPHTEDRFYMGAPNIDEPLRADFLLLTYRFTQEFQDELAFTAARAFPATAPSPRLLFRHPTVISGTLQRELELKSGSAQVQEWSAPIEGFGVIISTVSLQAFLNSTDGSSYVVRVRNAEAVLAA